LPESAFTDDYNGFYDSAGVLKEGDKYIWDYALGGVTMQYDPDVHQKVQKHLDKKQEKKEFKDVGKRVGGSKKEKRAYSLIVFSDLGNLEEDEITAAQMVTKDHVYPELNVAEQKAKGV